MDEVRAVLPPMLDFTWDPASSSPKLERTLGREEDD